MTAALLGGFLLAGGGCERLARDYFPLRAGNHWEYRVMNQAALEDLRRGRQIVVAPAADKAAARATAVPPRAEIILPENEKDGKSDAAHHQNEKAKTVPRTPRTVRRVVLELLPHRPKDDPLTWRALYNGVKQAWSKRDGFLSLQDGRGRTALLLLPPHTGYRWEVVRRNGTRLYFEIEGLEKLRTPAATFDRCVVSRRESRDRREAVKYWFAPEVGLVRRSKYFLGEEVFRMELVYYRTRASSPETMTLREKTVDEAVRGKCGKKKERLPWFGRR